MDDAPISPDQLSVSNDDLGPLHRRDAMRRLEAEHLDVLVIGGGVTGVGCALDAASRGLTAAVVEQRDLASGTSSRSSKLIHGGLRYLQRFEFGLVREALSERNLLITRIAPHLINRLDFLYPLRNLGRPAGHWRRILRIQECSFRKMNAQWLETTRVNRYLRKNVPKS